MFLKGHRLDFFFQRPIGNSFALSFLRHSERGKDYLRLLLIGLHRRYNKKHLNGREKVVQERSLHKKWGGESE